MTSKSDRTYFYLLGVFLSVILICIYIIFSIQFHPYNYLYFMLSALLIVVCFIRGLNEALLFSILFVFGHGTVILSRIYFYKTISEITLNDLIWLLFFPLIAIFSSLFGEHLQKLVQRYQVLEKNYHERVMLDEVTEFPNYRRFQIDLEEEVQRSARYQRPLVLLLVEIKYFTEIQKEYGENQTNKLLRDLSNGISLSIRNVDKRAYLENGVFALLLPETHPDRMNIVRSRLKESLKTNEIVREQKKKKIDVQLKFGIASSPDEGTDPRYIFQFAKQRLEKHVE
ncbi:GGDEF domain-containing protein [Ammoniphilus sp. 3BR4]|uniref:GGDEF domain-containing protein n=1 Tax=Ammoniphilus sp. 3BR4 TaxID=3158265 RepID=UPI0034673DD2